MSRETRRDIGEVLTEALESFAADAEIMAAPYRTAAEYRRRVDIATAYVADMDCTCTDYINFWDTCPKHYLERVLMGDE